MLQCPLPLASIQIFTVDAQKSTSRNQQSQSFISRESSICYERSYSVFLKRSQRSKRRHLLEHHECSPATWCWQDYKRECKMSWWFKVKLNQVLKLSIQNAERHPTPFLLKFIQGITLLFWSAGHNLYSELFVNWGVNCDRRPRGLDLLFIS